MLSLALAAGCATAPVPYTGQGPHPQLERGAPCPPVDLVGNILSLPLKLLLWSWKVNLHSISPATEAKLVEYVDTQHLSAFTDAKFRLNQYRPLQDLSRLAHNRHVAWPYRLVLGLPITVLTEVLLPGRLLPWGDYYNPYTNTVHLYSDHPAIALHEAGHVHDFSGRRFKGTYAALRLVPFVNLYQEYRATHEAIGYLRKTGDRDEELGAYKILFPAYGSYVGAYIFAPIGTVAGVVTGHLVGRTTAAARERRYHREPPPPPETVSTDGTHGALPQPAPADATPAAASP